MDAGAYMSPRQHKKSFSGSENMNLDDTKISEILGFNCTDSSAVEKALFTAINDDDRSRVLQIFQLVPSSTMLLQILLTTTYPNRDDFYQHESESLRDAEELLGLRYCLINQS
jgi:ABC-type lipoprotein export system ATPase subunit